MLFGLFGLQRPPFNGRVEAVYYFFGFLQHFVKSVMIFQFFCIFENFSQKR